jgi:phosphoribosylformylglycinamidine cyclo-ligase
MGRDRQRERSDRPGLSYRDAGVDIELQDSLLRRIKDLVRSTRTPGVLSELGSFGGLFAPDLDGMRSPVLVSSCDGIGTKLRVAFLTGVHDTVGRDLVHHCVNDILVQGARPLFFMDYLATGRIEPTVLAAVVKGIADGCRAAGCALLGGEIAEMPGFYADGEYDVAGFIVGLADRERIIDGSAIEPGDLLIGLPSAGLHTNGFSLARKIFFEVAGLEVGDRVPDLGTTVGEALLAEHRCYLGALREPVERGWVRGLAHITGGGLTDNLPRVLPPGTAARVEQAAWEVPPVFRYLQQRGSVAVDEMFRTFNMGIGMVVVVASDEAGRVESHLNGQGETYGRIGEVVAGEGGVSYV